MKQLYLSLLAMLILGYGMSTSFASEVSMIKNLKNYSYPQQSIVNAEIASLSQQAKNNEYRLGMVLLESAQVGNETLYQQTLHKMQTVLANDDKNAQQYSYKTWRLGRILLAADSIGDVTTATKAAAELKKLLADANTQKDAFSAWAWGYLAALNKTEYEYAKNSMLTTASALTEDYKKTQDSKLLPGKLSDALYAWIMDLQAAANAHDRKTYDFIVQQMKTLTNQKSLSAALTTSLHRNTESNDYPAWALSMVRLAAATIGDSSIYHELENSLTESIENAKKAGHSTNENSAYSAKSEATLAQLYQTIAIRRLAEQKND